MRNREEDAACGSGRFAVYFQDSPVHAFPASNADPCRSPCVDPTDLQQCNALNNATFALNTIVGCYCKSALQSAMSGALTGTRSRVEKLRALIAA